ncbi:hypothetical protein B0T22DRAFT_463718 [Podospora appendiculata]|uniref:Ubiquitin 3 binding protein But2 C-terminal domain-containing protein n=1 Tax=Podospora appendiculata TaxID=314037 RepID=A0AAE1CEF7_9PEZI|nr:hypothetical protein B0T22DRAFT_463718 [Podospora appendiculata]
MRVALFLVSALAAAVAGKKCRPKSSSSLASTSSIVPVEVMSSVSSSSSTTSSSSLFVSTTSSVEPSSSTSTSAATTSSESSSVSTISSIPSTTTSAAPAAITTVTGFCLKVVTPNRKNTGDHLGIVRVNTGIQFYVPNNGNVARFNLDTTTGRLTCNDTALAGLGVYAVGPFDNQFLQSPRVLAPPVADTAVPLVCANPEGRYDEGSVLRCSFTAQWSTGPRTYSTFLSSNLAITAGGGTVALWVDGYSSANYWSYEVAVFYGAQCAT